MRIILFVSIRLVKKNIYIYIILEYCRNTIYTFLCITNRYIIINYYYWACNIIYNNVSGNSIKILTS